MTITSLNQLKCYTAVAADSGDFEDLKKFSPVDVTTNPSLIFSAVSQAKYAGLINESVNYGETHGQTITQRVESAINFLHVVFGKEILDVIPGRVSTEVDPRLSYDKQGSIDRARRLISLYETVGVRKERVLIKLAATWEGIQAARELEMEGIHCNLTLLFSFPQAAACAEAGVTLISPFVGRILDWHIQNTDKKFYEPDEDPGVLFVTKIYNYYKKFNYKTEIMGASFRNIDQIKQLAGCDLLTISPSLLQELESTSDPVPRVLYEENAAESPNIQVSITETAFRWLLNEDEMASTKLSEGIRKFSADIRKLEKMFHERLEDLQR